MNFSVGEHVLVTLPRDGYGNIPVSKGVYRAILTYIDLDSTYVHFSFVDNPPSLAASVYTDLDVIWGIGIERISKSRIVLK